MQMMKGIRGFATKGIIGISILSIGCTLFAVGCQDSEIVTTRFTSVGDAFGKGAFARGWLPPILPFSSKGIVERNNVDMNRGEGEFTYDLKERDGYIKRLQALGASENIIHGWNVFVLRQDDSEWVVSLPPNSTHATYTIGLVSEL